MDINSKLRNITQSMMATSNDELLTAITIRIEKNTYLAAVNSGNPIDYLAKNLKRHLKTHGISSDELWFSLELAYENDCLKNPHIHGAIKIKRCQYQDLLHVLQGALGKPLVKSAARKRQVKEVYSLDWADYSLKNLDKTSQLIGRRAVFISRPLTKEQSKIFGKNDFSKNAQSPCLDWSESDSEKVLSSYVFKPLKITTKNIGELKHPTPTKCRPSIRTSLHKEDEKMRNAIVGLVGATILSGCANPMVEQYRADTTKPIIITDYHQAYPNSVGGVKVYLTAFNMTNKPIKYFDFWAKHYDRVGEIQADDITGETLRGYRFTGPYLKEKAISGNFGPWFYGFGANCMELGRVEVTYMDNTKQIFDGEALKSVIVTKGAKCRNALNR